MKPKVVILGYAPFSERWGKLYHTDYLSKYFDLEYWDCSKIVFPPFKITVGLEREYVIDIPDYQTYRKRLKTLPEDTLLISEVCELVQNKHYYHLVSKYVKNRIRFLIWYNPFDQLKTLPQKKVMPSESFGLRIKHWLYQMDWFYLLCKFIRYRGRNFKYEQERVRKLREMKNFEKCEHKILNMFTQYDISYLRGSQYTIHHPDYEKYLQIRNQAPVRDGRYVVYLSDFFPLHPDMLFTYPEFNGKAWANSFYASMNRFFEMVEKSFDCRVIIAEHPSGHHEKNPYQGREIVYYKTPELVNGSIAVCGQISMSMVFPVFFDKPICMFGCAATAALPARQHGIAERASLLHLPFIDIDALQDVSMAFQRVPTDVRDQFMNIYSASDENKSNAELIRDNLMAIHDDIHGRVGRKL